MMSGTWAGYNFKEIKSAFWVQEICRVVLDHSVWTNKGFDVDLPSMGVFQFKSILQKKLSA